MEITVDQALAVIRNAVAANDSDRRSGLHLALNCLESGLLQDGGVERSGGVATKGRQAGPRALFKLHCGSEVLIKICK